MVIIVALAKCSHERTCSRQLRVALSVLDVPESPEGRKWSRCQVGASAYPLVFSSVEPLMMGFAPLPYAPNVMGDPLDPLDGAISEVPYHASPLLNRIESPARMSAR